MSSSGDGCGKVGFLAVQKNGGCSHLIPQNAGLVALELSSFYYIKQVHNYAIPSRVHYSQGHACINSNTM